MYFISILLFNYSIMATGPTNFTFDLGGTEVDFYGAFELGNASNTLT